MGMTLEQFWDGAPSLVTMYRKAFRIKRELANEEAWLQGLYVFDAFAVVMANAFSKRSAKKLQYVEQPIDIFPLSDQEKQRREQEAQKKMQQAMEAMVRKQKRGKAKKKQKGE